LVANIFDASCRESETGDNNTGRQVDILLKYGAHFNNIGCYRNIFSFNKYTTTNGILI
jgi:hypothetical protein